jgi:hypothetical protein
MVLKYSLLPARVRLLDSPRDYAGNRRLQFHKRRQLFIRVHNETLFRPNDRATVGVLVAVGAAVCVAVAVAVDGADAVAVAVGRGVAVAVAVTVAVAVALAEGCSCSRRYWQRDRHARAQERFC